MGRLGLPSLRTSPKATYLKVDEKGQTGKRNNCEEDNERVDRTRGQSRGTLGGSSGRRVLRVVPARIAGLRRSARLPGEQQEAAQAPSAKGAGARRRSGPALLRRSVRS